MDVECALQCHFAKKKRGSNEAVVYRSGFKIAPQAPQCAAFYTVYTPPSSRTASSASGRFLLGHGGRAPHRRPGWGWLIPRRASLCDARAHDRGRNERERRAK